jgi:hypothetical protein
MNWKTYVGKIIPKLSRACYVIIYVYFLNDITTFKTIFYAYFHLVMEYCIVFWGNSPFSKKVLQIQKKIIRVMKGSPTVAHLNFYFET